jgi:hypothetical protein
MGRGLFPNIVVNKPPEARNQHEKQHHPSPSQSQIWSNTLAPSLDDVLRKFGPVSIILFEKSTLSIGGKIPFDPDIFI